jgi:hypothetical protein
MCSLGCVIGIARLAIRSIFEITDGIHSAFIAKRSVSVDGEGRSAGNCAGVDRLVCGVNLLNDDIFAETQS